MPFFAISATTWRKCSSSTPTAPCGTVRVRTVAFEWIGERNYLGELRRGEVAPDDGRIRGANFTSLDFCVRFRRSDGRIQLVAGEWKYTEYYAKGVDLRYSRSRSRTDRLDHIYREHLVKADCQIAGDVDLE